MFQIDRLGGGGSDFAAFLQHAGVPSTDIFFAAGKYLQFETYSVIYLNSLLFWTITCSKFWHDPTVLVFLGL